MQEDTIRTDNRSDGIVDVAAELWVDGMLAEDVHLYFPDFPEERIPDLRSFMNRMTLRALIFINIIYRRGRRERRAGPLLYGESIANQKAVVL